MGHQLEVTYSGATWSREGHRLLFIGRGRDGKQRLATVDLTGDLEEAEILYTEQRADHRLFGPAAWSPDGQQIVLSRQTPGNRPVPSSWSNTHLVSLAWPRSGPPRLLEPTKVGLINRGMWFSPDGSTIVFSSQR